MFQYVSLFAIARHHNATLVVPNNFLLRRSFQLSSEFVDPQLLKKMNLNFTRFYARDCCRLYPELFHLNESRMSVYGYFQSFRYFHSIRNLVVGHELKFLPEIQKLAKEHFLNITKKIFKTYEQTPTLVGVHVRRGLDMTWNSRNIAHGHKIATTVIPRIIPHLNS